MHFSWAAGLLFFVWIEVEISKSIKKKKKERYITYVKISNISRLAI